MSHILEVVSFRTNDGVSEKDFINAAQKTFNLLESYDGYITRELSLGEDGTWIDIVTWENMETALSAAEAIMQSEIGQVFGSMIDMETIHMRHVLPRISASA